MIKIWHIFFRQNFQNFKIISVEGIYFPHFFISGLEKNVQVQTVTQGCPLMGRRQPAIVSPGSQSLFELQHFFQAQKLKSAPVRSSGVCSWTKNQEKQMPTIHRIISKYIKNNYTAFLL